MTAAPPEAELVGAGEPAVVGGEAHGELSCTTVFTGSPCMDANMAAVLWVAGIVVALTVVAAVWLLRRTLSQRR